MDIVVFARVAIGAALALGLSAAAAPPARGAGALPSAPATASVPKAPSGPATAGEAAARLRALYFAQDFEGGYVEGTRLSGRFPGEPRLLAWFILHTSENGRRKEAIRDAEALRASHPESPWSWFALAYAVAQEPGRGRETLRASRLALAWMPEEPDAVWLRAWTLSDQGRMKQAIAFAEKWRARLADPAELLVVQAGALYAQAFRKTRDDAMIASADALFEEARRIDPRNVNAHYQHGLCLAHYAERPAEALPILETAARLAPLSTRVHEQYWDAVMARKDLKRERKHAEVEAGVRRLLKRRGDSPGALYAARRMYAWMKNERRAKEIETRLLATAPDSPEAEKLLAGDLEEFSEKSAHGGVKDPRERARYRKIFRAFVSRPIHHSDYLLARTYAALLETMRDDPSIEAGEVLEIVRAMLRSDVFIPGELYPAGVIALADRKTHFREAETIAREGLEKVRESAERSGWFDSRQQLQEYVRREQAGVHDALGWVYLNEGRLRDAEDELRHARDLNPASTVNLHHLGRLYEMTGDLEAAERSYVGGLVVEDPGENPNLAALRGLYVRTRGGAEGFEAYLERATDPDRARRKREILAARLEEPQPVPAFALETLDGVRVSDGDLRGRIVVINFWGLWCGWCLEEMPDVQKLHERYRGDPEVRVLTIDNDANPDSVRDWMRQKKYDFPVLLDDGYVATGADIRGFPTTWFLDREGRKVFEERGWSKYLTEEFSWRIEALRQPAPGARAGAGE